VLTEGLAMLRIVTWSLSFLILCVTIVFTLRNPQLVIINYYTDSIALHLAWLVLLVLVLGIALGIFFTLTWVWRIRRRYKTLQARCQQLEKQLNIHTPKKTQLITQSAKDAP